MSYPLINFPLRICTVNVNSWKAISGKKITYQDRLNGVADSLNQYASMHAILLQEVFASKADMLCKAFKDYDVFVPQGEFGPKTLLAVTLVKKSFYKSISMLPIDCKTPNRVNIIQVLPQNDQLLPFYLINCYMVNQYGVSNKHYDRPVLANNLWTRIFEFAVAHENDPVIIGGDTQEGSTDKNIMKLKKEYKYLEPVTGLTTCTNPRFGENNRIDHILYSNSEKLRYGSRSLTVDNQLISRKISDHLIIIANAAPITE